MKLSLAALMIIFISTIGIAQDKEYKLTEEYKISKNGTLHLSSDDADITIEGSDRENIYVDIYRSIDAVGFTWGDDDFEVKIEERDGDVYIKEVQKSSVNVSIGYYSEEYTIVIKVPKSVSLDLDGDDDDYIIRGINGDIDIDTDDSDVDLRNCGGDFFSFHMDDGDLTIDGAKGNLDIDIDDGDVWIKNGAFSNIDAKMDDGELTIETSLMDDGDYYFRSSDGRINLLISEGGGKFNVSHDDGSIRTSDEFEFLEKEEHRSIIRLPKGTANIRITSDDARVYLEKT